MSVAGFDVGNCTSCVALARKRGVDVLMNSESKRETPSLVSFGDKMRFVGVEGAAKLMMNVKNTVGLVKRLIGYKFKDPVVQEDIKSLMYKVEEGPDGGCLINVMYLNQPHKFTPEQVVAVLLKDLKKIAELEQGSTVTDCVVSVPVFFTEAQRYAMLSATNLAGLKCLRLMNEPTATALAYGIFKTDLPEDNPVNVAFVDVGYASLQVSIVAFKKGHMEVKAHTWDRSLGGRDLDAVLIQHFAQEFKQKTGLDILSNSKATFRMATAVERCRQMLTVNTEAPIAVECLMEDTDFKSHITREAFEKMASDVLQRVRLPCQRALEVAGISAADLGSVEMVGAASRTPSIVATVREAFNAEPKRTMNSKECVSTGCALQCAMLSPVFRVRDFDVKDCFPFPIELTYEKDGNLVTSPIFGPKDGKVQIYPSSKSIKFCKTEAFQVKLRYSAEAEIGEGQPRELACINIDSFKVKEGAQNAAVTVHLHLNLHGIVECTKVVKQHQEEAPVAETPTVAPAEVSAASDRAPAEGGAPGTGATPAADSSTGEAPMDTSETAPAAPAPAPEATPNEAAAPKKMKKVSAEMPFAMQSHNKMPVDNYEKLFEAEGHMAAQDHLQVATNVAKNELESYVYSLRSKLYENYADFVKEDVRSALVTDLDALENWLYEEGEDEVKSVYESKLTELKKRGDPIAMRYNESQTRDGAAAQLRAMCANFMAFADSQDERYAHVEDSERATVRAECSDAIKWLDDKVTQQATMAKTDEPALVTADIMKKAGVVERVCNPIMNKPPPKKEEPPAPAPDAATPKEGGDAAPMDEGGDAQAAAQADAAPPPSEGAPMDE